MSQSFGALGVSAEVEQALAARGIAEPFRIQSLVVPDALKGRDMLDMGFQPQVDRIVRCLPARRQTMLFSATLDGAVGELAHAYTINPSQFEAELPSRHADGEVEHEFVAVTDGDKLERLIDLLGN